MSYKPSWSKTTMIFGGTALWGMFLVGCVVVQRTVVAPPTIAGATYVGDSKCSQCHEDVTSKFHDATHAKLFAEDVKGEAIGCESCHGAGSLHAKAGGGRDNIVNPKNSPETCFQCHLDKRGEFALPNAHPVLEGKMNCSDCHSPHTGDAISEGGTNFTALNESCVKCHVQQGGPYVFEHEASREGCITCHSPHGSLNDKMLKARNANLCLQCHFQQQTAPGVILIGGRDHASFLSRGTCWSAGCHEAIHGSHVSSSLRF
ncbi:cytochrome c nitrite reductase pentaheme subunit [Lacunisphaera limnophila]|uniref:Cytochrome c nitrite reductase pentaheme subunit n=1 Tax=Lacunisphaera limnophila TaxID=1838286 RepID=A0A1D8AZC5_9BACT|nr:cytochrome c3 family protein [Lacunisphaera limnophila]AOS46248.1 cytochrome c nitrite reductase pentaheme subunit [Lacunisphaera limnophila]